MNGWKTYKAEEFCLTVTDGTHDSPKPKTCGRYLITSKHLKPSGIDFSSANKISEEDYNKIIQRSKVEQYDILFSMIGTIGNIHRVTISSVDFAVKNMGIFKMGGDANRSLWMYYWLQSPEAKEYINSRVSGSTQGYLTLGNLREFPIRVPSRIEEQKKITDILSAIDDKIEVNRRINDNLEQQAQALFKSWFVDFDTIKLGDVVTTTSGGTPSRKYPEYYDGNYGWVKSKELNGSFIIDTEEKITEQAISKSAAKMLPEKSVLIAMYGATVGQYALLSSPMSCNQAVCALLPNENYPYTYLFMFAKNKKEELINKAVGSAQQNISQVLIKDLDISNDILKIKQFHTIVNPFFETIEKNQQEITRLTTLRDTLLPKLMSGDIAIE